mmetsp:Transcript_37353/g.98820  ORF Transcript_37353/g.98820 Transcript_37353/m.98820 type:complete len:89 (-) Transcript_37353:306-572(-)
MRKIHTLSDVLGARATSCMHTLSRYAMTSAHSRSGASGSGSDAPSRPSRYWLCDVAHARAQPVRDFCLLAWRRLGLGCASTPALVGVA